MAFECGICTAMFNAAQRQPLILECGHTFCRHCILHSLGPQKWCPYCRQPITKHVDDLPRNYALENAMEAANMPLMELMDRWGLANAERMIVKPDQLQLVNLISRKGNTGEVWRGTLWGKSVAVKLVPLVGVDDRQLDCLRREVAVLLHTTGECKQVCIYKGFCVKNGNFAIIMKLYSYSLAARVARHPGRRLPLPLAMKYAIDIAKALVELHRLGVTAADLKPDNVLIDDELGDAVIADFGISTVVTVTIGIMAASGRHRRGTSNGLRSSGAMRGTPNYMAPEQFTPGHKATNKADIWGFAATLLHMVTGAPPWQNETLMQICTAVGVSKQSPQLPEGLPVQLEAIMRSCFEADPARRPTAPQLLKALQTLSPMLGTGPQPVHATSNLHRNSQLISAARGVLSGLQQDCSQLVKQLSADEQAAAAAAAGAPGRLQAVAEDQQIVVQQLQQKQRIGSNNDENTQAALDQYLAQLGLLSLMSRESSLGMPSAPPLPGGSSSSDPSRPGSSYSSRAGLGLTLSRVSSSSSSNKLPKVLWSEEEAVREEQEAQQQRRQQQQIQQQGLAANMGLASPRKVHHGRSVSEQVGAYNPAGYSSHSSAGYSAAGELQFSGLGSQQQQQVLQQQGLQSGSSSSPGLQQQQQHHGRSMSEVCQIWGARELQSHGSSSSRRAHAGPALPTHFESPIRGAEVGPSEAAAAAVDEDTDGGVYSKDDPHGGGSPAKQRKQWQIPGTPPPPPQQQQDQPDQQQQQAAGMYGQSKWPDGLAVASKQAGISDQQQQQQQANDGAGTSGVPSAAAAAAGPLTAAVAAHRSQQSISSASLLKASALTTHVDGPTAAALGADTASSGSTGSSSGSRAAAAPVPSSPRKHTRTLSNLLLGRGSSGSNASSPCSSPGKFPAAAVAARSVEYDSRSSCNSTPERARRGSGAVAGSSSSSSILAQAALGAGAAAIGAAAVVGGAASAAGLGVGTVGAATGSTAVAGGSALIGGAAGTAAAAAGAVAGLSRGAADAGKVVAPGVVASMAAKFNSGGGGSSSGNSSPSSVATAEPASPTKAGKSRWRALFGGSPKKRSQTPQQQHPVLPTAASADGIETRTLYRTETGGSSSSMGSVIIHEHPLVRSAMGATGAVGSRLGPHGSPGLDTTAAAAAGPAGFSGSMLPQSQLQQQPWPVDAVSHVAAAAAAPPAAGRCERSPHRDQDSRSSPSPSRFRPADNAAAATAALQAAAAADPKVSPSKDGAAGSPLAVQRAQGTCSPLRSHVRNLSMPSKLSGLGIGNTGTGSSSSSDQQKAAAGRSSPLKQQQQQQQPERQPEQKQAAVTPVAAKPPAQAGSSSSGGSSSQTHSQMLAEAGNLEGMARQLSASGRTAEAEEALRSALAIWIQQLGTSHPSVITATARLALHLHRNGKAGDAEGLFKEVLKHKQAMMGRKHPQVATAYANLAACLYSQENYAAAVKMYGASLEIRKAALGEQHADTAACMNNLALCYSRLGQHAEAEALYRQALATRSAALGQSHPDVATTAHSLGHCLSQLGRHSEALVLHKQGLWVRQQIASNSQGPGRGSSNSGDAAEPSTVARVRRSAGGASEDVVASHRNVALCLAKLGCDDQAEEHLAQVLEAKTGDVLALAVPPPPGVDHPPGVPVSGIDAAGVRHSRQASFAAAAALGLNPHKGPEDDVDWSFLADGDSRLSKPQQDALLGMAAAAEELARCFSRQGKHNNAEELYWQALEARSQVLGSRHELVQATEEQLRECLDRQC